VAARSTTCACRLCWLALLADWAQKRAIYSGCRRRIEEYYYLHMYLLSTLLHVGEGVLQLLHYLSGKRVKPLRKRRWRKTDDSKNNRMEGMNYMVKKLILLVSF